MEFEIDVEQVNKILKEQGRIKKWLAKKVDRSPGYILHILSGRQKPGSELVLAIAKALNVDVEKIITKQSA